MLNFVFSRVSYNGYYPSLPSWRRGFDSLHPLHIYIVSSPMCGLFLYLTL